MPRLHRPRTVRGLGLTLLLASLPALQGCFPIVAAGVGTGVVATIDRRSYGAQVEDSEIELRADKRANELAGDTGRVAVTSFNRLVLLTGQVARAELRSQIEQATRATANVRNVVNEITIGPAASFATRSNDALITSNVKALLFDQGVGVSGHHVKVVTDSNVVFLLGILTEREAQAAIETTRRAKGVEKVVSAFETISEEEARRLSPPPKPTKDSGGPGG